MAVHPWPAEEDGRLWPLAGTVPSGSAAARGGPERPVAVDDEAFVPAVKRHKPLKIAPLANDVATDAKLDPRSLEIVDPPDHGRLELRGKKVVYQPDPGFSGEDSFSYTVADRDGDVPDSATVRILVEPVTPPTAHHDSFDVAPQKPGKPVKLDVLANDDPGTFKIDPKSIEIVDAPDHGTIEVKGRRILYVPEPGYSGPDGFSYTVAGKDGSRSDPAVVSINVESAGGGGPVPGGGGGGGGFSGTLPPGMELVEVQGGRHVARPNTLLLGSSADETMVVGSPGTAVYYVAGLGGNDTYILDALPAVTIIQDTGGRDLLRFPSWFDPENTAGYTLGVLEIGDHLFIVDAEAGAGVLVVDWRTIGKIETWDLGRDGVRSHEWVVNALEEGRGDFYWRFDSWDDVLDLGGIGGNLRLLFLDNWQDVERVFDDVAAYGRSGRAKPAAMAGPDEAAADAPAGFGEIAAAALASLVPEPSETPVV